MHEIVETWSPEAQFFKFPDWQSNVNFPWPNELTICPAINGSKFQSKLHVLDTDDVKQKTSLFSIQGTSAWYVFMVFLFFCFMSSVSGTQNNCPNSHHSHPVHLFNTWIYRECTVQNGWISQETLNLLVVWFLDTTFCQWNMFNFGEFEGICHLPLASLKRVTNTEIPCLDLRGMINFPGMVTHVTH